MKEKLETENVLDEADVAAEHVIWKLYQPLVSQIAPEYVLEIQFSEE